MRPGSHAVRPGLTLALAALFLMGCPGEPEPPKCPPDCPPLPEAPAGYALELTPEETPEDIQTVLDIRIPVNRSYSLSNSLYVYSFPWEYSGEPTMDMALASAEVSSVVASLPQGHALSYAMLRDNMAEDVRGAHPMIQDTYGTEGETPQVWLAVDTYIGPGTRSMHRVAIILFPQSRRLLVYSEYFSYR